LAADYRRVCATLAREVSVSTTAGPTLVGEAIGVDADGRLQVATARGVRAIGAGDVEHVRPAQ
jgi:BirA family biotin operon repressor/biotin-[acetyl-CoA-carboxylase] ligase